MAFLDTSKIGKIKSLGLRDFLTYDELKYYPGSNLNLIIGPNGTGKSTILAGIILGCGGKPALIARSQKISDYVKNGKLKAYIEIKLIKNKEGDVKVFSRSFDRDNKDTWNIDGKKTTAKDYLFQIGKFNIQVDNLCMFLPQDRVQDFTKLNPQELLLNTMSSVCSTDINEAFDQLKSLRNDQKANSNTAAEHRKQLDDNTRRNDYLKTQIESNKRKDELIERESVMLVKKAYLECVDMKKKLDEMDADAKVLKDKIETKRRELVPLQRQQKQHENQKNALKNAVTATQNGVVQTSNELGKLHDSVIQADMSYNREKQRLRNVKQTLEEQKEQIREAELLVKVQKNDIARAESELDKQGDVTAEISAIGQKEAQCRAKIEHLMINRNKILQNLEESIQPAIRNCQRKIFAMTDTAKQKAESLRKLSEDAFKAYEWLKSNKNQFNSEIFFPPIIELTVKNKEFAKYIENTVAIRDLICFICTDKDDARKLFEIRKQKNWNINIATVDWSDEVLFQPSHPIDELPPSLGFKTYMIDVLDGPAPVLNHLCSLFRLHEVAIGDDRTYTNASQVPKDIRLFFSTNHRFVVTVSKYSGESSMMTQDIEARGLLNVGVDPRAREQEENHLKKWQAEAAKKQAELTKFEDQISQLEGQNNELRSKKKDLMKLSHNVQTYKEKLKKKEIELENLINRKIDMKAEQTKFKKSVDSIVAKKLNLAAQQVAKLTEFNQNIVAKILATKKQKLFVHTTGNIDVRIQETTNSINSTKNVLNTIENQITRLKTSFEAKKQEVKELAGDHAPTSKKYKHHKEFEELTSDMGELQNKIEELQGRIACIPGIDPKIIEEYDNRQKTIEMLKKLIEQESNQQASIEEQMVSLHEKWHAEITRVVTSINENFSEFFRKMGFVGEIDLIAKEERDYADYGIQIRVQYRDNEKLQVLNRHVQSGGERAVAIAVYTLSLQHLTHVPFRCVDEINQGMDPRNERKIFQMLVDITCRPGQSQYFFITPKLLSDLPSHELMTVSVVHNGEHIDDPFVFLDDDQVNGGQAGPSHAGGESQQVEYESDDEYDD